VQWEEDNMSAHDSRTRADLVHEQDPGAADEDLARRDALLLAAANAADLRFSDEQR